MSLAAQLAGARVFDLEQPRFAGMPMHPAHKPGYFYALHRRHRDSYRPEQFGPRSGSSGMLTMMEHSGTHIDALCHMACDMTMHGGVKVEEAERADGYRAARRRNDEAAARPRRAARRRRAPAASPQLPQNYAITADDLIAARAAPAASTVQAGRRAAGAHRLRDRCGTTRSDLPECRRRVEVGQPLGGGSAGRRGRRRQHGVGQHGRARSGDEDGAVRPRPSARRSTASTSSRT